MSRAKNERISESILVAAVQKRLGGVLSRNLLSDILRLMVNYMINQVENRKVFSINNFGTITYLVKKCKLSLKEKKKNNTQVHLKFIPHFKLMQQLEPRRELIIKKIMERTGI